jgi:hypothetical protein
MKLKTPIIPVKPTFAKVDAPHELHLEAICVFAAIGFFLDQDTYWKDQVVLRPGMINELDASGLLLSSKPWFQWHHTPRQMTFEKALEEFTQLFETIIKEQTENKKVILPLSGGLDSRAQAAALNHLNNNVVSYSYEFKNGYPETYIAEQIAKACGFEFKGYTIPKGYVWNVLDTLATLNGCFSDFTSPRQMAINEEFPKMQGDIFSLGHWGDVLFDSMNLPQLSKAEEVEIMSKKLVKKGGLELARALWTAWGLKGNFKDYFRDRIGALLEGIKIDDTNAKLRAFKSLYWAPRWTSVNLAVFEAQHPISIPYYDDRMCQFICTVPEAYLKNRLVQIAYIKKRVPKLAKVTWHSHHPFNLNTYHLDRFPYNTTYKVYHKLKRELKAVWGKPYVQRNWELQFLGEDNKRQVKRHLFESNLETWVPKKLIHHYVDAFYNENSLNHAHAINMLLVLSKFNQSITND